MAHIPDGVATIPVLAAGAVITAGGLALGLRALTPERMPRVAVLSAVFFVASLIHLPAGPASVHLILNGLMGAVLGVAAYPAIVVALLLQAVLFGFGGLVVLGLNAADMGVPAILAGLAFRALWRRDAPRRTAILGALCGGGAVVLTSLMLAAALALSGREFLPAAQVVLLTALPVVAVEAAFTAAALGLIARVKPELLEEQ